MNAPNQSTRLERLIPAAHDYLETKLATYDKPVLLWSGGKDSTVMLHLCLAIAPHTPVIQYREPWFAGRWAWMQAVAAKWHLTVFDYPPTRLALYEQDGSLATVSQYHVGNDTYLQMPRDIIEWSPETQADHPRWICGREDFLGRPTGTMSFPWDLMLIGHKVGDEDPLLGTVALNTDHVVNEHMADFCFPLIEWTDKDIWDYIDLYDVPMQNSRYDTAQRKSWEHNKFNSDYLPMCVNCIDCRRPVGEQVPCMKYGTAENVADLAPYEASLEHDYFTASNPKHQATATPRTVPVTDGL